MILHKYDENKLEELAACYRRILELVGEDPNREGLVKTPMRAAKAIMDVTRGYGEDPERIIGSAIFEHSGSQVVTVKDIEFYSLPGLSMCMPIGCKCKNASRARYVHCCHIHCRARA